MFTRRKQDDVCENPNSQKTRNNAKNNSNKTRNINTATNLTATATATSVINPITDLSNYTSSQNNDTPLLPPIISGKRINLPHGPHR